MIGIELATVFNALGGNVTIVEVSDRLLPNMDREFSDALEEILTNRGIEIHKESILEEITKKDCGLRCRYVCHGKNQKADVDAVLVSVGERRIRKGCLTRTYRSGQNGEESWWMISSLQTFRGCMRWATWSDRFS